jgi:transketolase C-terminal domain/subunit
LITLRTAGAEWTVDDTKDGTTITTGAVVSAEAVQAVADNLHDAKLAAAVADVAAVRRADAAGRVERLRAELTAAEALLASYTPGSPNHRK